MNDEHPPLCAHCQHWTQWAVQPDNSLRRIGDCDGLLNAPRGSRILVYVEASTIPTESEFGCIHFVKREDAP